MKRIHFTLSSPNSDLMETSTKLPVLEILLELGECPCSSLDKDAEYRSIRQEYQISGAAHRLVFPTLNLVHIGKGSDRC